MTVNYFAEFAFEIRSYRPTIFSPDFLTMFSAAFSGTPLCAPCWELWKSRSRHSNLPGSCLGASWTYRAACGKPGIRIQIYREPRVVPNALRLNPPGKPTWESLCAPSLWRLLAALTSFTNST